MCDKSAEPSVIKCMTMGAGQREIKRCSILRDVFYGRPLRGHSNNMSQNTQDGEGHKGGSETCRKLFELPLNGFRLI